MNAMRGFLYNHGDMPDGNGFDVAPTNYDMGLGRITLLMGECRRVMRTLPDASAQCVVTSPPYYGLRDYGTAEWEGGDPNCDHTGHACTKCGAVYNDRQIGLEKTPDEYVAQLVEVFRGVRRVLRGDGVVFLNLGDSYASSGEKKTGRNDEGTADLARRALVFRTGVAKAATGGNDTKTVRLNYGVKPKDLIGIPWRVAFALQADGWWLRSAIIWCLSGGTRVYAQTQKGEMPMTIKDMVRLNPATVQLWNGEKWTQVLGWGETPRPDRTYEIELRNGQRIGCTGSHVWPTQRGEVEAAELAVGDLIQTCRLPEPPAPKRPSALDDEMVGWFVGLYIAEGSRSDGTIQIASHLNEDARFERLRRLAEAFHGTTAIHKTSENGCTVNLNGPVLNGIIDTYVSGRVAADKHLHPRCWQRSDAFLSAILDGYLSGDGHWDAQNGRWRLGFCSNDELVSDLRTVGARLGVSVRLKRVIHKHGENEFPGYKGEIRFVRSSHPNSRHDGEIIAIRESRARRFWDISVADEPHLFALASGVLTHNCKPNPMPESVRDRPTSAYEMVFLLAKSASYFFDAEAVAETSAYPGDNRSARRDYRKELDPMCADNGSRARTGNPTSATRNIRNVWTIANQPYSESHFAVMPPELAKRCIKAGSRTGDTVLDPFGGVGTTGIVAAKLGRNAVLIDLNAKYVEMTRKHCLLEQLPFSTAARVALARR